MPASLPFCLSCTYIRTLLYVKAASHSNDSVGRGAGFVVRRPKARILLLASGWIPEFNCSMFWNSQLISPQRVGIFQQVSSSIYNFCFFIYSAPNSSSTVVLNTMTLTYLLLTEFEVRTVSYGPSFFPSDLWPKREACGP